MDQIVGVGMHISKREAGVLGTRLKAAKWGLKVSLLNRLHLSTLSTSNWAGFCGIEETV